MTPSQHAKFSNLVDQLWSGEIGEVEFFEVGLDMGASLTALHEAINDVREEDGTCPLPI